MGVFYLEICEDEREVFFSFKILIYLPDWYIQVKTDVKWRGKVANTKEIVTNWLDWILQDEEIFDVGMELRRMCGSCWIWKGLRQVERGWSLVGVEEERKSC